MPRVIGDIEFYTGPREVGGPDDLKKVIVDFIDGAQKRLFIAVQELDCREIAEAIVRARQRKVLVKIILEQDYLRASRFREHPFEEGGKQEINRQLHDALLRTNIDVKTDYNVNIFHQKFIVRDSTSLLTGSTNFTDTGVSTNLNNIAIIHDEKVAKLYYREFKELQQGHFGKLNEGHDPKPEEVTVSDIPVKVLFAPDHNPEMEIMKWMLKAEKTVDFAIFTFSQSSGIDDTMIAQSKAGLKIRGALDGMMANQKWAATHPVKDAGAELYSVSSQANLRKLHHKLMVLDEQVIITGSFNYTEPATRLNDENIIIFGSLETTDKASIGKQRKLAGYALREIHRIISTFGKPIV